MKIVTLSYDDGVYQDIKLIEILNKYNIKCTFNLNSSRLQKSDKWVKGGIVIDQIPLLEAQAVYKDHEVAVHTYNHYDLTQLSNAEIEAEVVTDKQYLFENFKTPMTSMAYPFGTYNQEVIDILASSGINTARTVKSTHNFEIPTNFLKWHPTCEHTDPQLDNLVDQFLKLDDDQVNIFYLWGHSYDFDVDNNWHVIEQFCQKMSEDQSIIYMTNNEVYQYVTNKKN